MKAAFQVRCSRRQAWWFIRKETAEDLSDGNGFSGGRQQKMNLIVAGYQEENSRGRSWWQRHFGKKTVRRKTDIRALSNYEVEAQIKGKSDSC